MKRALLFAGALAVATALLWLAGHALFKPPQRHDDEASWPYGLGKLRDVPKRYPSHDMSTNASDVVQLAAALGVDLAQETTTPRPADAMWPKVTQYVIDNVALGSDDVSEPAPALAQFLSHHEASLAALRAQLNANGPPRWRSDVQELNDPPHANYSGHAILSSLLAADALLRHRAGDDATAWLDLDAMWKLGRGLLADPGTWSTLSALSIARKTAGVAAKLAPPLPPWWRSFLDVDFDRARAAADQYDAWRYVTFTERYPAGEPDGDNALRESVRRGAEVVVGPFRIDRAQRAAENARRRALRAARETPCDATRTHRFVIEREGVARLLALKEAPRAGSEPSRCPGHEWRATSGVDGTIELALTPPFPPSTEPSRGLQLPYAYKLRASRRAAGRGVLDRTTLLTSAAGTDATTSRRRPPSRPAPAVLREGLRRDGETDRRRHPLG